MFYQTNRICQLLHFMYCFCTVWCVIKLIKYYFIVLIFPFFVLCSMFITHPVCSSETESDGNRTSLKHSTGQPWFVTIVKPWKISSPGDRVIKMVNVHSGWNWITNSCSFELQTDDSTAYTYSMHFIRCHNSIVLITSRKCLVLSLQQPLIWKWC